MQTDMEFFYIYRYVYDIKAAVRSDVTELNTMSEVWFDELSQWIDAGAGGALRNMSKHCHLTPGRAFAFLRMDNSILFKRGMQDFHRAEIYRKRGKLDGNGIARAWIPEEQ